MTALDQVERSFPTGALAVGEATAERTLESVRAAGASVYAEIGVYEGATAQGVARHLNGNGEIHLFDFADRVDAVAERLEAEGHSNIVRHPNSRKILDSYNWSLMRLLEQRDEPLFDYVFIDGSHTWGIDALAFLLVDRLLKPGGHVEFDDYYWTLARSPSMNPDVFPATRRLYTEEQIDQPQVALVVDLLVRRDARYEELVPDRLFRKRAQE